MAAAPVHPHLVHGAPKLADHLMRRYHTAKVQRIASPAGDWWVRVRVLDDDRQRAQNLAAETHTPEGAVDLWSHWIRKTVASGRKFVSHFLT